MRVSIEEIVFIHEEINNELQRTPTNSIRTRAYGVRFSSYYLIVFFALFAGKKIMHVASGSDISVAEY
jgi:hypothetical protein